MNKDSVLEKERGVPYGAVEAASELQQEKRTFPITLSLFMSK